MKLTPEMKEIAHRVKVELSKEFDQAEEPTEEWACVFAERFLSALPKPEPVGTFYQCLDGSYRPCTEHYEHAEKLYTAPPPQDTAAIAAAPKQEK